MKSLFSEEYDDHFYSSKESEPQKPEKQEEVETPEEREEREMRELTYERSTNKKRWFIIGGISLLVVGVVTALWLRYFHPYIVSEESGVILKVKSEGTFIKTYEVMMISEKFITDTTRAFKADFQFTVRRLTVKYEEFKGMLPWRGESNRFATAIVVNGVAYTGEEAEAPKPSPQPQVDE